MRKFIGKLITFILRFFVISIFLIITYMCLDLFEIIKVPEEYDFAKIWLSKLEIMDDIESFIKTNTEDEKIVIGNTTIVELQGNYVTTIFLEDKLSENTNPYFFRYYDQLNENSKKIYDALEKDKDKLKTGNFKFDFGTEFDELLHTENGSQYLNDSFQLAVNVFLYDHPEIFYIDITKIYLLTRITTRPFSKTYEVSIGPNEGNYWFDEYKSEVDVEIAINKVELEKELIKQNINGDIYGKLKYVHDYLVDNISYEKEIESHNNYNIYGTLINKKAVCEGYAKTFKYIIDDFKIPCVVTFGQAQNSSGQTEDHAWNYVQINNNWYAIDVTWDDPIIIGNGYLTKAKKYKYFLKGANSFFTDHVEDGSILDLGVFKYPVLKSEDF